MRYTAYSLEWLKLKTLTLQSIDKDVKKQWELSPTDGGDVKCYNHFGKQFGNFLKSEIYIYHTTHSILSIYPRDMKAHVYTEPYMQLFIAAFFGNSQKLERIQMPIIRLMDKQIVDYPYTRILFSNKKEQTIYIKTHQIVIL